MYTNNMKFVESHEWVQLEQDNIAKVGISHHAQELLGDIVYIELPKLGQCIKSGNTIGVIESVKAASDLYAPISGEVIEINENVINDPTIINQDPHNEGWLIKVKLSDANELNNLMDMDKYKQFAGI